MHFVAGLLAGDGYDLTSSLAAIAGTVSVKQLGKSRILLERCMTYFANTRHVAEPIITNKSNVVEPILIFVACMSCNLDSLTRVDFGQHTQN